jgi:hypothetical protein
VLSRARDMVPPCNVKPELPRTQPFGAEAFEVSDGTVLRWLGVAGFLINSRGTTVMIDPFWAVLTCR